MTAEWDPVSAWAEIENGEADSACTVYHPLIAACPVARTEEVFGGFWGVYDEKTLVATALDNKTYSNEVRFFGVRRPPLECDPPEHTAYRRMINQYFRASEMEKLEPVVRRYAGEMIESLIDRCRADFASEFTHPFPTRVLCALMGIPDSDWKIINDWTLEVDRRGGRSAPTDPARQEVGRIIMPYLRELIAGRRLALGDDIVSGMISGQIQGRPLGDEEIVGLVMMLVSAGHNTTTNGIGNLILRLARDVNLQTVLRANPGRIPDAVEECLRIDAPQQAMRRVARRDADLGGRSVKEGEYVWLAFGSANLDPERWDRPGEFDVDRQDRRHVAFGHGIHLCVGAPLARMQMRVVTEELLARTASFGIAGEIRRPEWPRLGVTALPLAFEPAATV